MSIPKLNIGGGKMSKVQVNVIKGPNFKLAEERTFQYLHGLMLEKGRELQKKEQEQPKKDEAI